MPEAGRWWIPGQWEAGSEEYLWEGQVAPRCHHPLRMGDRLYVSYSMAGVFILDISDIAKPKVVGRRCHRLASQTRPSRPSIGAPQTAHNGTYVLVISRL